MKRVPHYPGFPTGPKRSHFHALARAIIHQQLAGRAADTIYRRVKGLSGRSSRFPTPREMLGIPEESLRGAGLSKAKHRAITELAAKSESGELKLSTLGRLPDDEVIAQLTTVWGIGVWSAQMFLLFKLGRLDVMPTGDLGVQEGLRRLDGLEARPTPGELLARSEPWRPLSSVATWVLYRLCDIEAPA